MYIVGAVGDNMYKLGDRFWSKVNKTESCWLWTASTKPQGYGEFRLNGGNKYAHRLVFAELNGPIPEGIEIDHKCYNRSCVNPKHLRPVTKAQNGHNRSGLNRNNSSGVRGVVWLKANRKWMAQAKLNNKRHYIGSYDTIEEAEKAVVSWRRENMPHSLSDKDLAA